MDDSTKKGICTQLEDANPNDIRDIILFSMRHLSTDCILQIVEDVKARAKSLLIDKLNEAKQGVDQAEKNLCLASELHDTLVNSVKNL